MGGTDITHDARANNKAEAEDAYERKCKEDEECYGHQDGYAGGMHQTEGLYVLDKIAKDSNEAEELAEKEDLDKGGAVVGILYHCKDGKDGAKVHPSTREKYNKMSAELVELRKELEEADDKVMSAFVKEHGHVQARGASYTVAGFGWGSYGCPSSVRYHEASEEQKNAAEKKNKELVPCNHCHSRIVRRHVFQAKCPVCKETMCKPATSKELAVKRRRVKHLAEKLQKHPQLFKIHMRAYVRT